jgi:colanic acid/amylovoran biosynthesis glycosyltransferase
VTLTYLINQYPAPSHTFIRREIAALEAMGIAVTRVSLRPQTGASIDPDDERERGITRVILGKGSVARLGAGLVREAVANPPRFARAVALTLTLARKSERGLIAHLAYLAEACVLKGWAREAGTPHIHAHFGTNPAAVARLCRSLDGPTYSLTVHGPEEFDSPRALSLGEKVHGATFVAAISEFTRSQLYRWAETADWSKIHVVRCGLDAEFFTQPFEPPPETDCPQLINIGRFVEQKGQLVLIEAAARLAAEGRVFRIVLVGDGPMRGEIETRIQRSGLADRVVLLGWKDGAGVREELRRSRALVLSSFAEGLPVVLMEALAMGRPVISTSVAGIPELVEPGVNGWLVPAGSAEALATAIGEALDASTDRLNRMGRTGAAMVAERHQITTEAEKLAVLFAQSAIPVSSRPEADLALTLSAKSDK